MSGIADHQWRRCFSSSLESLLEGFYDSWVAGFDLSPVLTIKSDDLDFVHKQPHLETVVRRIDKILAGKEEMEFPRLGG